MSLVKSKLLGATLIVAGVNIGASMLALPIISSSLGGGMSILLLIFMWLVGYFSAFVALKINLFYNCASSVSELTKKTFSARVAILADLSIVVLFYSLLAAYISGIVYTFVSIGAFSEDIDKYLGFLIVSLLAFLILSNLKLFDLINKVIFSFKIIFFLVMIVLIFPYISIENIVDFSEATCQNDNLFYKAVPIFFTAFGFHGSIPFIIKYLNNDAVQINKAFFFGTMICLIVYCIWILSAIAVLPQHGALSFENIGHEGDSLGSLIKALSNFTDQKFLSIVVSLFSWLAIVTSFLGVGIGLYDYVLEKLKLNIDSTDSKIKAGLITFLPPLLVVLISKNIFIKALSFAAISLSILAIIFPAAIALKISKNNRDILNKPLVILFLLIGVGIIIVDVYFHLI